MSTPEPAADGDLGSSATSKSEGTDTTKTWYQQQNSYVDIASIKRIVESINRILLN